MNEITQEWMSFISHFQFNSAIVPYVAMFFSELLLIFLHFYLWIGWIAFNGLPQIYRSSWKQYGRKAYGTLNCTFIKIFRIRKEHFLFVIIIIMKRRYAFIAMELFQKNYHEYRRTVWNKDLHIASRPFRTVHNNNTVLAQSSIKHLK